MLPLFFEFDKESGFCPIVEKFDHLLASGGESCWCQMFFCIKHAV